MSMQNCQSLLIILHIDSRVTAIDATFVDNQQLITIRLSDRNIKQLSSGQVANEL